jgi:hypothetical protein
MAWKHPSAALGGRATKTTHITNAVIAYADFRQYEAYADCHRGAAPVRLLSKFRVYGDSATIA